MAPEELVLRPSAGDDAEQLRMVFSAATDEAAGQPVDRRSVDEVREWCRRVLSDPELETWVAETSEGVVGFATLADAWLNLLFVHPGRDAPGVGRALLDLAKGLRPHGFGLRVVRDNARARDFYRRHGLVELEHTDGSDHPDRLPDVRMAWLGDDPVDYLRREIDAVDDELAVLLARRFALTAAVQGHKASAGTDAGHAGRDAGREREIVERMARHVPGLPPDRLVPIMHAVIGEGLTAWEQRP